MARRFSKSTTRFSKGGKNYIWTVVLAQGVTVSIDSLPSIFPIVSDSDWSANAGAATATILAVRGYVNITSIGTSFSSTKWYIGKQDKDIVTGTGIDPSVAQIYVDEDIMYTGGWDKPPGAVADSQVCHEIVDVKAKRKLQKGVDLRLVIGTSTVSQTAVSLVLRALLQINNG